MSLGSITCGTLDKAQVGIGPASGCPILEGSTAYVGFDECKEPFTNYWYCDGTADNVQVDLALAYISAAGGGQLFMEAGAYVFAAQVNIDFSDIVIQGVGEATQITYLGIGFCFYFNNAQGARYNATVDRIKFVGDPTDDENQILSFRDYTNITVSHCYFEDVGDEAITFNVGSRNGKILNNEFTNCCAADAEGAPICLQSGHHLIDGNTILGGGLGFGVHLEAIAATEDISDVRITNNSINSTGVDAVRLTAAAFDISDVIITGNMIDDAGDEGIEFVTTPGQSTDNITIEANNITGSAGAGILTGSLQAVTNVKILSNTIYGSGSDGINTTAKGWIINDNDIQGSAGDGIELASGSGYCKINDNRINLNNTNGVYLTGSSNNTIEDNHIIDNKADGAGAENGIKLNNNCDDNQIQGNHITTTVATRQEYGIKIVDAASERNRVFDNYMLGNATAPMYDGGTDTIFHRESFQFTEAIVGDIVTTSPTGIDVDATTEGALAWGQLPTEVQQVMKLKIWAVATDAPIGSPGQMHLEVFFNAGASNAAYNEAGKSWTIADFDGEEVDYVADDVVHWVIEDADVGTELSNLVAGDSFELLAMWEVGADPDGATDALFRVVEVEYV